VIVKETLINPENAEPVIIGHDTKYVTIYKGLSHVPQNIIRV
jgi:hypothetical protein